MSNRGRPRARPPVRALDACEAAGRYRGVGYRARERAFVARVDITVGYFADAAEAARARDAKVRELGLDLPLNFPDERTA